MDFSFEKTSPKQVNICNQIEISCGNYLFSWGLIFTGENSMQEGLSCCKPVLGIWVVGGGWEIPLSAAKCHHFPVMEMIWWKSWNSSSKREKHELPPYMFLENTAVWDRAHLEQR